MIKKTLYVIPLIVLLISSCKKNEDVVVDKPFYPAVGAINARYSIGDTTTVVFAQGNLQYQATTKTWRFAAHQYDIIGIDNEQVDTSFSGWIDLFGWGTSGYNGLMPYTIVDTNSYYGIADQNICGTDFDWGCYNSISNGGEKLHVWRTMSYNEWKYLFSFREGAGMKRGLATIQNAQADGSPMYGLMLLPDKWELPQGCTFRHGIDEGFATNEYTIEQWMKMEGAGAVFLPAAGYRDKNKVSLVGEYGCYWTGSYNDDATAYELYIQSLGYALSTAARSNGHSVRLVQER
jgi:hypothetical protein